MADLFVSTSGDDSDGLTWAKAFNLFNTAVAAIGAGETITVDSTHDETISATTVWAFSAGTFAAPIKVISATNSGGVYTAGAKITISVQDLNIQGNVQFYGMVLDVTGDDFFFGSGGGVIQLYDDCTLSSADQVRLCNSADSKCEFLDCALSASDAATNGAYNVLIECAVLLRGCTLTHPNTATLFSEGDNVNLRLEDCDISADSTNITNGIGSNGHVSIVLSRCKMKASWTALGAGAIATPHASMLVEGCTDGTSLTNPELGLTQFENYYGTITSVQTPDRTGGADDGENGLYSWKMDATVGTVIAGFTALESPPLMRWVDSDGTPSGATSLGRYTSTRADPLATPANLTTDSGSTWNGSGVGTKQLITHTLQNQDAATLTVFVASGITLTDAEFWITVQEPDQVGGPIIVRCHLARNVVVYVDPRIDIDGITTDGIEYFTQGVMVNETTGGGGGGGGSVSPIFQTGSRQIGVQES